MFHFILVHWSEIVACFSSFFGFFVSLAAFFSKKKKSDLLALLGKIPEKLAEIDPLTPPGSGAFKLDVVLSWIELRCKDLHLSFDPDFFRSYIESVLSAPTKKK